MLLSDLPSMRTPVQIRLVLATWVAGLAACTVGEAPLGGTSSPDAAGSDHSTPGDGAAPSQGDGAITTPDAAAGFQCRNKVTTGLDSGHHNAGQDCQNGCHDHGFTVSGTFYTTVNGAAPVAGATITVLDAAGQTFDMHSGTNGNFWSSTLVTYPLTITASECPTVMPMTEPVQSGAGGCNKVGCHSGSPTGRIHL